ncbi:hypothetical protein LguiB_028040 [Lonicera macranthoides]
MSIFLRNNTQQKTSMAATKQIHNRTASKQLIRTIAESIETYFLSSKQLYRI